MGMYTEFHFNSALKKDTPMLVINLIKAMVGELEESYDIPKHPLFEESTRWNIMLRCDSSYFDADTHSTIRYDDITGQYYLSITCNFKNYANEINHFIDWIHPYLDKNPGDFLGFSRYEETEMPTLLFYNSNKEQNQ